jgi:hypothetical protein
MAAAEGSTVLKGARMVFGPISLVSFYTPSLDTLAALTNIE